MKAHLYVSKESEEKCFLAWERMDGVPAFPSVRSGSAWLLPLRCWYLADGSSWELLQQQWGGDTATHVSHLCWVQEPHRAAQQCVRSWGLKDEALPKFLVVSSYGFSLSFVKYSICLKR